MGVFRRTTQSVAPRVTPSQVTEGQRRVALPVASPILGPGDLFTDNATPRDDFVITALAPAGDGISEEEVSVVDIDVREV